MKSSRRKPVARGVIIAIVIVALIILKSSIHIVGAGERAVVFNTMSGVKDVTLHAGINFLIPFVDSPRSYDVRTRTFLFSDASSGESEVQQGAINAKTSDAQAVFIDLTVRYHIDPEKVHLLHQLVGPDYEAKIIQPSAGGTARKIVAAYNAEEVFSSKRQEIEEKLTEELTLAFAERYIVLDGVLLRNVSFSPEYHRAIEQKQIGLQRAEKKQYELKKERAEKTRKIIAARSEAAAIEIRGQSLAQYPAVVEYEYIENLPENVPTYVISGTPIVGMSDLFGRRPAPAPETSQ